MTDTLTGYFTVGTVDLRRALRAVLPHVSTDETVPNLNVVHLDRGPVNLTVTATDRFTAGHAIVSVLDWGDDPTDGTMGAFDLSVEDVKKVLALFKPSKGKSDNEEDPESLLRIDLTDDDVTVTDTSGLFPSGQSLRLPRTSAGDDYPDVERLIGKMLRAPATGAARLVSNPDFGRRFAEAGRAYGGAALVLEPTGDTQAIVVSCGESFVGLWMPIRTTPETDVDLRLWRDAWLRRLPSDGTVAGLVEEMRDLQSMGVPVVEEPDIEPGDGQGGFEVDVEGDA
jgi:hypothetical protein